MWMIRSTKGVDSHSLQCRRRYTLNARFPTGVPSLFDPLTRLPFCRATGQSVPTFTKANAMHFVPELLVKRGAPLAIVWRAAHGQLKGVSKRDRERVRLFGSPAHPNPKVPTPRA